MARNETPLVRDALSESGMVCWRATLAAFGVKVEGDRPEHFHVYSQHLIDAGYRLDRVVVPETYSTNNDLRSRQYYARHRTTLGQFIAAHPTGDFVVRTRRHVMALRDGILTDTDLISTGRRYVVSAYRVTRG